MAFRKALNLIQIRKEIQMESNAKEINSTVGLAWSLAYLALIIGCIWMLCATGCSYDGPPKKDDARYLHDLDMIIVEKAGFVNTSGKCTSLGKYFLLKGVKDTTLYWEYHGLNGGLSDSMYYNHKVGDWLHFDYVLNSSYRFFHKNR